MAPATPPIVRTVKTEELKFEFGAVRSAREPLDAVWDDVEAYIMPLNGTRPVSGGGDGAVNWTRPELWDSTAVVSAQLLASSLHGRITPSTAKWFKLSFRDKALQDDARNRDWLETVEERIWQALGDSDFYTEIASSYQDLVGYGNACMVEEPGKADSWGGLDFTAVRLRECWPVLDTDGSILRWYRLLSWTAVQIVRFCEKHGVTPPEKHAAAAKTPDGAVNKYDVVYCIFRREGVEDPQGPVVPHLRPVGGVYFDLESAQPLSAEDGFYDMNVFIVPWEKTSGSTWGHGPGIRALPTVKYLNSLCEGTRTAMEKAVDPAWAVSERGMLSDLNVGPGEYTTVRDPEKDIRPLESGSRFDVARMDLEDLRAQVRSFFLVDELQLKDSPAMTAEEARLRWEQIQRGLGSTHGRIKDVLDQVIYVGVGIMARQGQLPPMPPGLAEVAAKAKAEGKRLEWNIEYQGSLARSERVEEVAAIERGFMFAANLAKLGFVEALDAVDVVQGVKKVFSLLGAPASVTPSDQEIMKRRKMREELQARMAQAQTAQAEGEAAAAQAEGAAAGGAGGLFAPGGGVA